QVVIGVGLLHGVGPGDAARGELVAYRRNRIAARRGLAQAPGDVADQAGIQGHRVILVYSFADSSASDATCSGGIFASVSRSAIMSTALQLPDDCAYSPYWTAAIGLPSRDIAVTTPSIVQSARPPISATVFLL